MLNFPLNILWSKCLLMLLTLSYLQDPLLAFEGLFFEKHLRKTPKQVFSGSLGCLGTCNRNQGLICGLHWLESGWRCQNWRFFIISWNLHIVEFLATLLGQSQMKDLARHFSTENTQGFWNFFGNYWTKLTWKVKGEQSPIIHFPFHLPAHCSFHWQGK